MSGVRTTYTREFIDGKPGKIIDERKPKSRRDLKRECAKVVTPKPAKPKKGGEPVKIYTAKEKAAYLAR